MADYNINAITRRVVFTGSAGVGPYAFSFEVLDQNDVAVYFNTTSLTLTTDYTVTVNANGTGSVTLVTGSGVPTTPTASDTVIIIGARDIERVTDFVTAGDLLASSLNEQLDALTIINQQLAEEGQRSMRAPVYDPALVADGGTLDMTLPPKADRVDTVMAFDTNGNPVKGPTVTGITTITALAADITTLADIEDGTVATDAISDTAAIKTDVTTVAGIAADVTAAAANSANITAAVANAANINAAPANAQLAADWAVKVNGIVDSTDYSSKAWSIGGTGVTDTAGAGPAKDWATETTGQVDGTEYSAKEYAVGTQTRGTTGSAKDWATYTGGTVDASEYSAKHYAQVAAASVATFDDKYAGAKTNDTAADTYFTSGGRTKDTGDLYYSTSSGNVRIWNGTAWEDAVVSTSGFATNGFAIAMAIAL